MTPLDLAHIDTLAIPPDKPEIYSTIPDWLQECINACYVNSQATECSVEQKLICQAFEFANDLHRGQYRKSGEPYICHPVAVAGLLKYLGGDSAMIAAGFLHDIVEDTETTVEDLQRLFGNEVALLVEGVTKLSKFNFSSKTEQQAENFRRMFLAMAQDIRVIVVKLADRLHNMRTLDHLAPEKRRAIALETRDIFAPLANRLGIGRFKWELEDLSFKYLEEEPYRQIQKLVSDKRTDREAKLTELTDILRNRMEKADIKCYEISGRPKHLYGIYQKMQRRNKEFHEVYDIAAVRIIVDNKEECYRTLAIVHDSFRPIPGRFKDYIGLPKPNRYQSLHTGVIGTSGRPVEVQIRTVEMHHIAEYGIAAHWKYKETGNSNTQVSTEDEKFTWLRQLLEWQNDLKDANEYLETVKGNLFDEDIYVFTPKGDVISLTNNSTPVDFAYRIHSEVGNRCMGAKLNGRMIPLDTPLKNGDIVDILTNKNGHPSLDWLNFVVTSGAKNRIRQWYKRSHRDENISRGKQLLEEELGKKVSDSLLKTGPMKAVAQKCNYQNVDDLLAALGYGEITRNFVVKRWREIAKDNIETDNHQELTNSTFTAENTSKSLPLPTNTNKSSPISGIEGLMYHLSGCCNPIPGESIIAVVTRTKGLSIHRQGCHNLEHVPGDRLMPVAWNPNYQNAGRSQTYPVNLSVEVLDRVGVLKDILSRLTDNNINVQKVLVKTNPGQPAIIDLCIDITDREQLERTFNQVRNMTDVLNLRRIGELE
ncbi:MAG: RelA/SpoT family protein [Microcoleaceae cyanobacterium]